MKSSNYSTHILSVLAICLFVLIAFGSEEDNSETNQSPKSVREIKIEKQFSGWDGSHTNLTELIKKAMNDPDSYKHIETVYWDMKNYIVVRTTYSGTNAFGGRVRNWVKAKVDDEGNVLEIIEEGTGTP